MNMRLNLLTILFIVYGVAVFAAEPDDESNNAAAAKSLEDDPTIRLESTFVGDKEQPAVSYFIPWQGTSTPDKLQWEIQQKHDTTLQLIDRDVMLRSINMYEEMNLEATQ